MDWASGAVEVEPSSRGRFSRVKVKDAEMPEGASASLGPQAASRASRSSRSTGSHFTIRLIGHTPLSNCIVAHLL